MTVRWCSVVQELAEVTPDGICNACGKRVIGWIKDTGGEYPHSPPSVEGTQVTEEVSAMAPPEAGQPDQPGVEQPAQPDQPAQQAGEAPAPPAQPEAPANPDPAQGEAAATPADAPSQEQAAAVGEQPSPEAAPEQPSGQQGFVVVHGTLSGIIVGQSDDQGNIAPFASREDAERYQNDALTANPGQPVTVYGLQPS